MKKILYIVMAMAFALPVGLALADENMPKGPEKGLYTPNGITYMDREGAACSHASDMSVEGSAAGGLSSGAVVEVGNGITAFELGKAVCASGPAERESGKKIENGITYFD